MKAVEDEQVVEACGHTCNLVDKRAKNELSGPAKWYTHFHAMTCPSCRAVLMRKRGLSESEDVRSS